MTRSARKSFLELSVLWKDVDMFELGVTAANANFSGKTQVYDQSAGLLKFAASLSAYPLRNLVLFYESGKKGGYAYFSMKYYSIGFNGYIGVEINIESNVAKEYEQGEKDKLKLEIIVEPNQIDIFKNELYQLAKTESGKATLHGTDR